MKRLIAGLILISFPVFAAAENAAPPGAAPTAVVIGTPAAPVVDVANAPRIKFAIKKWDFGKVIEGPKVKRIVHFTNTGKSPLIIEQVQTSCGCTAAEAEGRKEIPPGEDGAIRVEYNTKDRPGKANKTVTVVSNDPLNKNFELKFDVEVVRLVDAQPSRVSFFGIKKGETRNQLVKVLGLEDKPLRILSAKSANGAVAVTMKALTEGARSGATIDVSVPVDKPIGEIRDEIVLATSYKKSPEVRIPVFGEVIGRVQVLPKRAFLNGPTGNSTILQVTADPPEGFQVLKAKAAKGLVNTKVKKLKTPDGKVNWQVVVSIPWLQKDGPIDDELTVTTNDPEQPEFKIPVAGMKSKPEKH